MLAGQAIGNSVMDLLATPNTNANTKSSNSENSVADSKNSISFDKMLSQSAYQGRTQNKDYSSKSAVSEAFNQKSAKTTNTANTTSKMQSNNKVKTTQLNTDSTSTKQSDSSIAEKVVSVVNEVKESVMETLDLSEEELVSMMEMLGLGMMDLLNPDTLKSLVLNQAGTSDDSMLLTDEGLGQQFNQLLTNLNDLMKDANLTMEDVLGVVEDPVKIDEVMNLLKETQPVIEKEEVVTSQEKVEVKPEVEEQNDSKETTEDSHIQFTVVKEESKTSQDSSSSMNSDSGKEKSQDNYKTESTMTNQFMDQLANVNATTNEASFSENLREIHEIREIADQIIDQIKLTIKPTETSMEFTLNPEHLGKVALNISTKNGILTASFTTQNELAKEAIESQMQVLKDNLSNQGIKVEAIEVTVSDFEFQQENQMSQEGNQQSSNSSNSKRPFRMNAGDESFVEQVEETPEQVTVDSGSNIDYSA